MVWRTARGDAGAAPGCARSHRGTGKFFDMIVAGLTGSMGMGKSTVAAYFRRNGIPVDDADQIVHDLYTGEAAELIEAVFPGTVRNGAVDRAVLAERVIASPEALKKLEAIVHPLVRRAEWRFLLKEQDKGAELA